MGTFTFFTPPSKDPKTFAKQILREKKGWNEPVGETVFGLWEYFQVTGQTEIHHTHPSGGKRLFYLKCPLEAGIFSDNT